MKLDRLETHDRYLEFMKIAELIDQGVQDCKNNVPDTIKSPFYVFVHKRTVAMDEKLAIWAQEIQTPFKYRRFQRFDQIPEKRIIYCPYPRRPKPQSNSWLVRVQKGSDRIGVVWIIPEEELWGQFGKELLCENELICRSIQLFRTNPGALEYDPDELTVEQVDDFRMKIKEAAQAKNKIKQDFSAASLILPE